MSDKPEAPVRAVRCGLRLASACCLPATSVAFAAAAAAFTSRVDGLAADSAGETGRAGVADLRPALRRSFAAPLPACPELVAGRVACTALQRDGLHRCLA